MHQIMLLALWAITGPKVMQVLQAAVASMGPRSLRISSRFSKSSMPSDTTATGSRK